MKKHVNSVFSKALIFCLFYCAKLGKREIQNNNSKEKRLQIARKLIKITNVIHYACKDYIFVLPMEGFSFFLSCKGTMLKRGKKPKSPLVL